MGIYLFIGGVFMLVGAVAYGVYCHREREKLLRKYIELKSVRDSYVENVVERICRNEQALLDQRSLLNTSLQELELLAANTKGSFREILDSADAKQWLAGNLDVSENLSDLTSKLRNQIYNYIPVENTHLGGTIQTLEDFIRFIQLSMEKYKQRESISIHLEITTDEVVDKRKFIYHDQDFFVRWFIFLANLSASCEDINKPPFLKIHIGEGKTRDSYHIKSSVVLYSTNILNDEFNEDYRYFFHSGNKPKSWDGINHSLLQALELSSFYSVLVNCDINKQFKTTTIYLERDCYVSLDKTIFKQINDLRKKYTACELAFIAEDGNEYEHTYINEIFEIVGRQVQQIPASDFSPSLLSRTVWIFLSQNIAYSEREKILKQVLFCPFSKIKCCVVLSVGEPEMMEHERVYYIRTPISSKKISQLLQS